MNQSNTRLFRLHLCLSLLVFLFAGCSDKPQPNLSVYRALASSLNNSNFFITSQNLLVFKEMERKSANPKSSNPASLWQPKALEIQKLSSEIYEYIDSMKLDLKHEAGLMMIGGKEVFNEDDFNSVSELFEKKGKGVIGK